MSAHRRGERTIGDVERERHRRGDHQVFQHDVVEPVLGERRIGLGHGFLAWSHFLRKTGSPLFRKMLRLTRDNSSAPARPRPGWPRWQPRYGAGANAATAIRARS